MLSLEEDALPSSGRVGEAGRVESCCPRAGMGEYEGKAGIYTIEALCHILSPMSRN